MPRSSLTDALRETLTLFDAWGAPRTTTEVAEQLGLGRRSTYERLDRLVDQRRLETKKVGGNGRVWWRPAESATPDAPDWEAAAESLVDDVLDQADVGVFVLDADFEVAWINGATERYFGLDRERVLGRDKRQLVDERIASVLEDSTAFAETVLATYDDNTYTERFECHVTPGDGRDERWLAHRSEPIESGAYAGGRVELYYDVTDLKREERTHQAAREQFESLVDAVEEYAIFLLDPDGYVQTWNPGAARIEGYDAEDVVGEHFSTFYTADERDDGVPATNLAEAVSEGSIEAEGWRVRADGSQFWASVTMTAIRDDDGALEGFAKVVRDLTGRRERERQLRRERDLIDRIVDTSPVGIMVLDGDGNRVRINERGKEVLGIPDDRVESYSPSDRTVYDVDGNLVSLDDHPFSRTLETGESVFDWQAKVELPDGGHRWLSVNSAPVFDADGEIERVITTGEDITQLKTQAERLERQRDEIGSELETIFERVDDGFFALDDELRFTFVNDRAGAFLERSPAELEGMYIWDALEQGPKAAAAFEEALAAQESVTFEEFYEPTGTWFNNHVYPSEEGLSVSFRDITEEKDREQELEKATQRYRTLVDNFPNGIVALFDEDLRYLIAGGELYEALGRSPDDTVGETLYDRRPPAEVDRLEPHYRAALNGESHSFEIEYDGLTLQFQVVPVRNGDGDVFAGMAMSQDVTERRAHERYLADAKSQLEAATEAGAVGTFEWDVQDDEMVMGPSFAEMFGVDPDAARDGVSLDRFVDGIHEDDRDRVEAAVEAALESCGEYEEEYRLRNGDDEVRWVVVRGRVECEDGTPVSFPGALTDITERKEAEIESEQQRHRLAALNELNGVFREITGAAIDQSSREEIEAIVCERLADSDSYLFAWIGDREVGTETVDLRYEAGVGGYLDDVTISVDQEDERGRGPTGRAIRTGETQATHDIRTDDRHDPWRGLIEQYGFRSSVAIPIVHENTNYGVLNVYAERPDAFRGEERDVVDQLGEIVGHAIAAVERKRALMSDEVVELQFQVDDVFESMGIDVSETAPIHLEQTVPVGDDDYVLFGRTTPAGVESVEAMVETLPFYEGVTFHEDGDETVFELRVSEPPVLSAIASLGGSVPGAVIENGDYHLTVHLSPSVDVREVLDRMHEEHPDGYLVKQHQRSIRDHSVPVGSELLSALTPRQRSALETAFHAGFFEWPREMSGEDVASLLDVSAPTFHQHLRKAELHVFESLLSSTAPA
ncbi:PAS domain-containing protein [Halorientalis halophila]|uniref:PAS domain-containing protein n=1 Tax=Halorientalis halophila TaxID=3108499 RepID=UPI00300ACD0B